MKNRITTDDIMRDWISKGSPVPPPPLYKQLLVREYGKAYKIKILVETGTFLGEMILACHDNFDRIYSIELDKSLFVNATENFRSMGHIKILQGDSSVELPGVLSKIMLPALFWLDGHYSGGFTAKGKTNTPILKELTHIIRHPVKNHVILIDDARCFNGTEDYPSIEELKEMIDNNLPQSVFEVRNDIIRITPDLTEFNIRKKTLISSKSVFL
jgi:hypothetical protein